MWNPVRQLVLLGFLCVLSAWDIRHGEIPEMAVWLAGGAGLLLLLLEPGRSLWGKMAELYQLPISCLPGFIALLLGELTSEKLGKGDGWLLVAMGLYLNAGAIYLAFAFGICTATMTGLALAWKKRKNSVEIPLIPFLMTGVWMVIWLEGCK